MSTLKLDSTGDLDLTNNSLEVLDDLVGETAQRLQTKLKFFLGEGFQDTRAGLPLFEKILKKNPDMGEVRTLISETILGDPAVDSLESLTFDFDSASRALSMTFAATLNDGSSLTLEDFILGENL